MSDIPTFPPPLRRTLPLPLAVVLSTVTGALGTLGVFWFFPDIRQTRIPPGTQTVIVEQPGTVVIEESTRIRELRIESQPQLGGLYHAAAAVPVGERTLYPPEYSIGNAVLLTADGWFGTTAGVGAVVGDILVVRGEGYKVERLLRDPASSLVLGWVRAERFSVVHFADEGQRYPGMTLFALSGDGGTVKTTLVRDHQPLNPTRGSVASSDRLSFGLSLGPLPGLLSGTPVFSLDGTLVGVVETLDDSVVVLPSSALASLLTAMLKSRAPRRATLGVEYLFDSGEGSTKPPAAVVYGAATGAGVAPRSPAARGGLRAGDRLTSIGGEPVTGPGSIFTLLQAYSPQSEVTIEYERGDEDREAVVVLGEQPLEIQKLSN